LRGGELEVGEEQGQKQKENCCRVDQGGDEKSDETHPEDSTRLIFFGAEKKNNATGGKNEIPSWEWFRAFSFFLSTNNVYFSLVAGSPSCCQQTEVVCLPNFFCGTEKEK